jgi:hypothetical protein
MNIHNASIIPGTKMSDIFYNSNIRLIYRGFNKILTSMTRKYGLNVSQNLCDPYQSWLVYNITPYINASCKEVKGSKRKSLVSIWN